MLWAVTLKARGEGADCLGWPDCNPFPRWLVIRGPLLAFSNCQEEPCLEQSAFAMGLGKENSPSLCTQGWKSVHQQCYHNFADGTTVKNKIMITVIRHSIYCLPCFYIFILEERPSFWLSTVQSVTAITINDNLEDLKYSLEQYIGFAVRQAFNYYCSLHQVWREAEN